MGKRRAESAFEDNSVINGFLEWMDAPEGSVFPSYSMRYKRTLA
jgi:hypothetical protein